jgi:S-formylglutathione hydrolase FrmB
VPTATPLQASPSAPPPAQTIGQAADDGARVVAVETVDARTRDLTIDSPSVGVQKARLVLPLSFDTRPTVRWPVLYFLHTANDTEPYLNDSYVTRAPAPNVFEGYSQLHDTLVVVPEGGAWGWYSDWWNDGKGGPPMWETFQLQEVRQLIERNWRAGDKRVVVGASMGGYGAIEYTTRHPELFVGAASISGPLSIVGRDDPEMASAWGDPVAQAAVWRAHDPLHHVAALKGAGITLFISYGDGRPAPPDDPAGPIDDTEAGIAKGDDAFVAMLKALAVPATVHAFGPGHHLQFFDREFERAVTIMAKALSDGQ